MHHPSKHSSSRETSRWFSSTCIKTYLSWLTSFRMMNYVLVFILFVLVYVSSNSILTTRNSSSSSSSVATTFPERPLVDDASKISTAILNTLSETSSETNMDSEDTSMSYQYELDSTDASSSSTSSSDVSKSFVQEGGDFGDCEKQVLSNMYTASKDSQQHSFIVSNNPHYLLRKASRLTSAKYHCEHRNRLYYTRIGVPHFAEGTRQMERALSTRGWTYRPWSSIGIPEQVSFLYASCRSLHRPHYWSNPRLPRLVSGLSSQERVATTKQHFMRSIRTYFRLKKCDYKALFPETIALGGKEECEAFLKLVDNPTKEAQQATWFLKTHVEVSFGRGVRVVNLAQAGEAVRTEAGGCDAGGYRFVVQKGVADILRYKGGKTQGRSYILISSLLPEAKVFFFPGYVNVAAKSSSSSSSSSTGGGAINAEEEVENMEANRENGESEEGEEEEDLEDNGSDPIDGLNPNEHVANLKNNQGSGRVSHQVLNTYLRESLGASEKQIVGLRQRLKLAATHVFMALRKDLGKPRKGSFALLGLDYVMTQKDRGSDFDVKILETNCNCELFFHEQKWGRARVRASDALVPDLLDLVVSTNEESLGDSKTFVEAMKLHAEALKDPKFSIEMDSFIDENGEQYMPRTWELIHSDANPVFSLLKNETECF